MPHVYPSYRCRLALFHPENSWSKVVSSPHIPSNELDCLGRKCWSWGMFLVYREKYQKEIHILMNTPRPKERFRSGCRFTLMVLFGRAFATSRAD